MREIKFRAWVPKDKVMIQHREVIERAHLQFNDSLNHTDVVMRFTGCYDAEINGTEVYEYDIIQNCDTKEYEVVYWDENKAAWYCRYVNDDDRIVSLVDSLGNLNKIVGNLYENPELLS